MSGGAEGIPRLAGDHAQDVVRLPAWDRVCTQAGEGKRLLGQFNGSDVVSLSGAGSAPVSQGLGAEIALFSSCIQRGLEITRGEVVVPPAMVQVGEFVFDPRKGIGVGEGGSSFVAGDCGTVVPLEGLQVTDGFVERTGLGMSERESNLVVGETFGVGIEFAGVAPAR